MPACWRAPATFQRAVYQIHSLGQGLPLVEWAFIFLPILFHGIFGVVIIRGGLANYGAYPLRQQHAIHAAAGDWM